MKRRIALIRQRYTPFGGAERFVDRALAALTKQGAELTLITRRWTGEPPCTVHRCDPFYFGRRWRDASFARCVQAHLQSHIYDLAQSHERIAGCDIYRAGDGVHRAWLAHRRRVAPRWQHVLDVLSPYHRYVLHAEASMLRHPRLRAVICNSKLVRDEMQQYYGVANEKLRVIYSGIDIERFHPRLREQSRAAVRAQLEIPSEESLFLYVGSGYERKGVAPLLRTLARLPRGHAVIIGKEKRQGHYESLARELGVASRCHFVGAQKDVAPYYGAADVFVLPTLYDPFPNVVLEAMASGLPVITTPTCGGADFIAPGVHGDIVDALDEAALGRAMEHLLDPERRQAMGLAARAAVEPYTLEKMGQQLVDLYEELLQSATPPDARTPTPGR